MTRSYLLDRLFSINRNYRHHNVIQRCTIIRYTNLAIMYLYPIIVNGKFNTRNSFIQIDLVEELKQLRYITKGDLS